MQIPFHSNAKIIDLVTGQWKKLLSASLSFLVPLSCFASHKRMSYKKLKPGKNQWSVRTHGTVGLFIMSL